MLVEILGDKEYVIEDSFLLDASITTEEIWAPLPHFDPTGQPDKYSWHNRSKNKQIQKKRILYHQFCFWRNYIVTAP